MASACSRIAHRASISSIKSATKSSFRAACFTNPASASSLPSRSATPVCRFFLSRCPSELGCVDSLLPLHNAVSDSRMTSCLSTTSRNCRALSQVAADSNLTCMGYIHRFKNSSHSYEGIALNLVVCKNEAYIDQATKEIRKTYMDLIALGQIKHSHSFG